MVVVVSCYLAWAPSFCPCSFSIRLSIDNINANITDMLAPIASRTYLAILHPSYQNAVFKLFFFATTANINNHDNSSFVPSIIVWPRRTCNVGLFVDTRYCLRDGSVDRHDCWQEALRILINDIRLTLTEYSSVLRGKKRSTDQKTASEVQWGYFKRHHPDA